MGKSSDSLSLPEAIDLREMELFVALARQNSWAVKFSGTAIVCLD
jgi:hypothetical protein